LLAAVSACSPFAPTARTPLSTTLPQSYSLYSENPPQQGAWWQDFAWDDLNSLITKALAQNLSLQESWARLEQAQANARITGAERIPTLNYTDSAEHTRSAQTTDNNSVISTTNTFTFALASSYEIDFWGRVAANVNVANLTTQASKDDWRTAQITIAAQVAETWISLVAQRGLVPLAHERWKRAQQQLDLLQLRYRQGMVNGLDVAEQQRRVAEYRAAILPLEEQEQQLNYELALLLGELPSWRWIPHQLPSQQILPALPGLPALGVPADLLAQRPDIRAAGLRLQAADWQVSAARADRLPALSLSASGSIYDDNLTEIFDNWLANLAASITGPLVDGGLRKATVINAQAVVAERLASYKKTVLTGMKEVETALMQEGKRSQELQAISEQLHQQQVLCTQQQQRYVNGEGSYLALLGAQQTLTLLQQQQLQMQRDLLLARTALHRALGGRVVI
jgi:NodT family efflux transporter outer membrane factor (OMF) lipoprotein